MKEYFNVDNINSLQFFYVVSGVSLVVNLILNVLSKKKAIDFLLVYHVYEPEREKYDFSKTLRHYKLFALILLIYSLIIIFLTYIFGIVVSNVGLWIFFIMVIVGSKFLNPVKK